MKLTLLRIVKKEFKPFVNAERMVAVKESSDKDFIYRKAKEFPVEQVTYYLLGFIPVYRVTNYNQFISVKMKD